MELRNHPIMVCNGVRTWPPKWLQTYGPTPHSAAGEVGILDAVFLSRLIPPDKVYLTITTDDGNSYLGSLMFEKPTGAKKIYTLLNAHVNESISHIGAIELLEDLE